MKKLLHCHDWRFFARNLKIVRTSFFLYLDRYCRYCYTKLNNSFQKWHDWTNQMTVCFMFVEYFFPFFVFFFFFLVLVARVPKHPVYARESRALDAIKHTSSGTLYQNTWKRILVCVPWNRRTRTHKVACAFAIVHIRAASCACAWDLESSSLCRETPPRHHEAGRRKCTRSFFAPRGVCCSFHFFVRIYEFLRHFCLNVAPKLAQL